MVLEQTNKPYMVLLDGQLVNAGENLDTDIFSCLQETSATFFISGSANVGTPAVTVYLYVYDEASKKFLNLGSLGSFTNPDAISVCIVAAGADASAGDATAIKLPMPAKFKFVLNAESMSGGDSCYVTVGANYYNS